MIRKLLVGALLVGSLTACSDRFVEDCKARGGHVEKKSEVVYTKNGGTYKRTTRFCIYKGRVLDKEST